MVEDACRLSPLTSEREQQLAAIIEAAPRDPHGIPCGPEAVAAMQELVEHNVRFAVKEGVRFANMNRGRISSDETVSAALLGLSIAATKYRPLGYRFASYAAHGIRSEVRSAIRHTVGATSFPSSAFDALPSVTRCCSKLPPTSPLRNDSNHIAREAGIRPDQAEASLALLRDKRSLNDPLRDGGVAEKVDLLVDEEYGDMGRFLDSLSDKSEVEHLLSCLDGRARSAVGAYFFDGKTMSEIGREVGCTPQNVSRMILVALESVREKHKRYISQAR